MFASSMGESAKTTKKRPFKLIRRGRQSIWDLHGACNHLFRHVFLSKPSYFCIYTRLSFASEVDGGWPIAGVIVGIDRVQVCNLCARSLPILKKSKTHGLES